MVTYGCFSVTEMRAVNAVTLYGCKMYLSGQRKSGVLTYVCVV